MWARWLKVLREAHSGENPYLASISELADLEDQIEKESAELEGLRDKGRPPLNVFQRFEKAGMINEYRSLYNFLSCDAHSNIRALISRHVTFNDSDFEITYYKDEPIEAFNSILGSSAGLLLQASLEMHNRYETESVGWECLGRVVCITNHIDT